MYWLAAMFGIGIGEYGIWIGCGRSYLKGQVEIVEIVMDSQKW